MKKLLFVILLLSIFGGCSGLNTKKYTEEEIIAAVVVDNVYILNKKWF